jgi:Rad52/22 family double-strand break repair protein
MGYSMIPTISASGLGDDWERKAAEKAAVQQQDKPAGPRDWTIATIIEALSRPLPESMLKNRKQGGANLAYIPWHTVNRILDKYAPGWTWEITNTVATADRFIITGRLTIPAAEGNIYREATGTEALKEEYFDKDAGAKKFREIAYGDVSSNAEGMAFRRCAARFGLGLYLYEKK